jgi:CRP/FNR family transcriptional regulator, cyclic AMP receptor protein
MPLSCQSNTHHRVVKACAFHEIDVFRGLSPAVLSRLQSVTRAVELPANAPLLTAGEVGEAVYFVLSGTVCIYRQQAEGGRFILNLVGAGETLGEVCALDRGGHSASAIATEPVRLLRMRRDEFCALEREVPELSHNVKCLLTKRLRFAGARCEALAPYDVRRRVARLLTAFADRYCDNSFPLPSSISDIQPKNPSDSPQSLRHSETEDIRAMGILIPLRLTQNDLSEMTGVTRQHINKNLTALERAGCILRLSHHRLVVRDQTALAHHGQ